MTADPASWLHPLVMSVVSSSLSATVRTGFRIARRGRVVRGVAARQLAPGAGKRKQHGQQRAGRERYRAVVDTGDWLTDTRISYDTVADSYASQLRGALDETRSEEHT